eukprot:m.101715 g.101715  ORF g.101715 m.101715 type:complete len:316 (-) comp27344_c2_seq4:56-1003(-)
MTDSNKKAKLQSSTLMAHHNVETWRTDNAALFHPPVCNKLMYKSQLNVMFVGGPNTRTDFHLDLGSEFFFQMKGNMELPTIQAGKRKLVRVREGDVFLLPSRIPHSPQRPETGSFGLVIERTRNAGELDGLRWYTDFDTCDTVLWEKYFKCDDLGKDLVPVVVEYKSSEEAKSFVPADHVVPDDQRPWAQDVTTEVPEPFNFESAVAKNSEALSRGEAIPLFGDDHPDKEFSILLCGGGGSNSASATWTSWKYDTWLYQHTGSIVVVIRNGDVETETELLKGCCAIVPPNTMYKTKRNANSVGLVVTQDPEGNKT